MLERPNGINGGVYVPDFHQILSHCLNGEKLRLRVTKDAKTSATFLAGSTVTTTTTYEYLDEALLLRYCQQQQSHRVQRRRGKRSMPVVFMPKANKRCAEEEEEVAAQQSMSLFGFLSFVIALVNVVISQTASNSNNNNNNNNNNNDNNNNNNLVNVQAQSSNNNMANMNMVTAGRRRRRRRRKRGGTWGKRNGIGSFYNLRPSETPATPNAYREHEIHTVALIFIDLCLKSALHKWTEEMLQEGLREAREAVSQMSVAKPISVFALLLNDAVLSYHRQ